MDEKQAKTIKAVETSFEILETLDTLEPVGVSQLATHLDMPASTVFVHLNTLVHVGYVVKEGTEYHRSLRFLQTGGTIRSKTEAAQLLRKKIEDIAYHTGEIAGAAVEERGQRIILFRSTGRMAAGDEIPVGSHTHMHWTSLGKAILAYLPEEQIMEIVNRHGLPRGTEKTLTSRDALLKELESIRQQGYAMDNEEHLYGVRGIAVPILTTDQEVIGSIGITGPRNRFESTYIADLIDMLKYTKNEIEVRSQY
jgi:DNA-binding IclR family transcriptional regulator